MKKHLLLFLLLANNAFCQSPSLDESKVTDSLNVSISRNGQNHKFTITDKVKATYNYTIWKLENKQVLAQPVDSFSKSYDLSDQVSNKLLKLLNKENLMSLPEDKSGGTDGYFLTITFSDNQTSKKLVYWSPELMPWNEKCKKINEITSQISEDFKTDSLNRVFINTLPGGMYGSGLFWNIEVDRFLDDTIPKTDFYIRAASEMQTRLGITEATKHTEYPIIIIDEQYSYIADLNNYTLNDIISFKVIVPSEKAKAHYGEDEKKGIITVTTKRKK